MAARRGAGGLAPAPGRHLAARRAGQGAWRWGPWGHWDWPIWQLRTPSPSFWPAQAEFGQCVCSRFWRLQRLCVLRAPVYTRPGLGMALYYQPPFCQPQHPPPKLPPFQPPPYYGSPPPPSTRSRASSGSMLAGGWLGELPPLQASDVLAALAPTAAFQPFPQPATPVPPPSQDHEYNRPSTPVPAPILCSPPSLPQGDGVPQEDSAGGAVPATALMGGVGDPEGTLENLDDILSSVGIGPDDLAAAAAAFPREAPVNSSVDEELGKASLLILSSRAMFDPRIDVCGEADGEEEKVGEPEGESFLNYGTPAPPPATAAPSDHFYPAAFPSFYYSQELAQAQAPF